MGSMMECGKHCPDGVALLGTGRSEAVCLTRQETLRNLGFLVLASIMTRNTRRIANIALESRIERKCWPLDQGVCLCPVLMDVRPILGPVPGGGAFGS